MADPNAMMQWASKKMGDPAGGDIPAPGAPPDPGGPASAYELLSKALSMLCGHPVEVKPIAAPMAPAMAPGGPPKPPMPPGGAKPNPFGGGAPKPFGGGPPKF